MAEDLKQMYKTIMDDHFTPQMEVSFVDGDRRQTLFYEKVSWVIDDVEKGLRYGENPGQEAALYRLVNGNLTHGDATTILMKDGSLWTSGDARNNGRMSQSTSFQRLILPEGERAVDIAAGGCHTLLLAFSQENQ